MTTTSKSKPFKRLLLTGAGGGLGSVLRDRIKPWADVVRLSDVKDLGEPRDGEEIMCCDLADRDAVLAMMDGVEAVLHFGGISVEDKFEPIMQANILGLHHLYEAAYKSGVKRVVYASSNHVVGFYPTTQLVDADMPVRPDGFYGLSKSFGEALSRYYFDRFGIETVCLRIGSSFPEPRNTRMMDLPGLRRPGGTGALLAVHAARRPHHRLRRVRQRGALVRQPQGRAPGLCGEIKLAALRRQLPRHRRAAGTGRLAKHVPGRPVRDHRPDVQRLNG